MTHVLGVFDGLSQVGEVQFDPLNETFSYRYTPEWRGHKAAYTLSPTFSLSADPVQYGSIRRFIENLLPEGQALDIVASARQISKNNIFGLIREIGRETTGALAFLPEGLQPAQGKSDLREIALVELRQRIKERDTYPFAIWDGNARLSIAGYQDKLAVHLAGDRIFLPTDRFVSTHILKPEPLDNRMAGLVVNEHFCMKLAKTLKLDVAEVEIQRLPEPVLVVERFDRRRTEMGIQRIHTIDTCQALDLPVSYKYERNFGSNPDVRHIRDGVSFERLFATTTHTSRKAVAQLALLRWALFQFLIGNSDAHGKNLSFYCRPEGLELAPAYDLVSVVQFPDVSHEFAMAFGDEFALANVTPFDFADFAKRTGIARSLLAREMRSLAKKASKAAGEQAESPMYLAEERDQVQRILGFVQAQANALDQMAKPMLEIADDDL